MSKPNGSSLTDSFKSLGVTDVHEDPRPTLQRQLSIDTSKQPTKQENQDVLAPLTPASKPVTPSKTPPSLSRQSSITAYLFDNDNDNNEQVSEPVDKTPSTTPSITPTRNTIRLQRQSSMAAAFSFDGFEDEPSSLKNTKTTTIPVSEITEEQFIAAASSGDLAAIKTMITHVNIDCKDGSALYAAVNNEHLVVVEYLIKRSAMVNLECVPGSFPLFIAASKGYLNILEQLVKGGADLNQTERKQSQIHNKTCTYIAAENGHELCVDFLVGQGSNVNVISNIDFNTVVHLLAQRNNLLAVTMMISHGANVSIKNNKGKTCLDLLQSERERLKVMIDADITYDTLIAYNYALWFAMIKEDVLSMDMADVFAFTNLIQKVEKLLLISPSLATAKDANGRFAMDVASKPMKVVLQSASLWHGRYRLLETRPEHISATCYVYKAIDEKTIDNETQQPMKVALKLMKKKSEFLREITARDKGFRSDLIMNILQVYPEIGSPIYFNQPDEITDVEADATGQLTKINAEKLFLLVMPLAERNLFVALKQERWAGKNMEEVRHVFTQLVHCVEHMHEKGVLHGDLKTLNIVRTAGQWKLIDLDAACEIGKEPVGHKSSSAYVPPEAIYVDEKTNEAYVRSVVGNGSNSALAHVDGSGSAVDSNGGNTTISTTGSGGNGLVLLNSTNYKLLTAHPSYDIWSLGCILYQMCTMDVKPLFQGGQDDNLVGTRKGMDNLFTLAEWNTHTKSDKLFEITDQLARNLLSQMLHKDPSRRPTLSRLLAHPFLSNKKVARMIGEKPTYDIFLSYRVASDSLHVQKLYNMLLLQGFKVYWDKMCLEPGVDWEEGFCTGLMNSRAFVPLLSREAINHPDKTWQNFTKLTPDSKCDNVLLEHRLAVELRQLGLIEKIFPVFIGDMDPTTSEYTHYFSSGCHPSSLPTFSVISVEEKLRFHMENQALGTPMVPDRSVASVVEVITACQGSFVVGSVDETFAAAVHSMTKMLTDSSSSSPEKEDRNGSGNYLSSLNSHRSMYTNNSIGSINTLLSPRNTLLSPRLPKINHRQSMDSGSLTPIQALNGGGTGNVSGNITPSMRTPRGGSIDRSSAYDLIDQKEKELKAERDLNRALTTEVLRIEKDTNKNLTAANKNLLEEMASLREEITLQQQEIDTQKNHNTLLNQEKTEFQEKLDGLQSQLDLALKSLTENNTTVLQTKLEQITASLHAGFENVEALILHMQAIIKRV